MIRPTSMAALALMLFAGCMPAQAPSGMQQATAGLQMRLDQSTSAADPDDVPDVTIAQVGRGYQVNTGPAAVVWNPANTASGVYTLRGTFTLQSPSDHVNYYGLAFGGRQLEGSGQGYLYFLVAQNGTFIVKHRAGDETTHDLQARTPHAAIIQPNASGQSVNALEVRVGASQLDFVVNGTVVHTMPKTGMAAATDGIYGVRINHRLPGVLVEGLEVTR